MIHNYRILVKQYIKHILCRVACTDTLLLCKSLQVNKEGISRTTRKPVCDAFMLQLLTTMMPVQEWIIFSFWMNGFSSSCNVLTDVLSCLPSQDWRFHSERTAFIDCMSRFVYDHVMWNSWMNQKYYLIAEQHSGN